MKHFFISLTVLLSIYVLYTSADLSEFQWFHDGVTGVYKNEDGSLGIKFECRPGYLQIKTLNDVVLVYFDSYREVDKRLARSVYMLDGEYLQHKSNVHGHLDRPVGNATRSFNDTMDDLIQLEETRLLEDASRAIGEQGVTGRNTPAVLSFYMFALKVTRLLDTSLQNETINELDQEMSPSTSAPSQQKRFLKGLIRRILSGRCDKYKKYKDCKGLCGKGCNCWWWVCGDCCYHRACYDHDDCCERRGYSHWRCIIAPDVFLCDLPFIC